MKKRRLYDASNKRFEGLKPKRKQQRRDARNYGSVIYVVRQVFGGLTQ